MTPDKSQQRAIDVAAKGKVMIMTGGPGTGKSFTINHILNAMDYAPTDVALAAPTGKAAKRMSESCGGRPASTIHRLLEYSPRGGGFTRDRENPLDETLIIVDEASMIDIQLMKSLLDAVRPGARLILVGDKDQLPSVGPGNVLRDLIASECLPVAHLDTIHRQSEHSWIPVNAKLINEGKPPIIDDPNSEDFFVEFIEDPAAVRRRIIELVTEVIPQGKALNPFVDIQLLCPQRGGPLGVHGDNKNKGLNRELQERLNPLSGDEETTYRGFGIGDKVIHCRNNYDLGVMNGETGLVHAVNRSDKEHPLIVKFDDGRTVEYRPIDVDDLMLGYGLTIHKSQGSEWPAVVMPISWTNQFMLNRNLFYTGLTRGKSLVYILTDQRALKKAVRNSGAQKRHTHLTSLLRIMSGKNGAGRAA